MTTQDDVASSSKAIWMRVRESRSAEDAALRTFLRADDAFARVQARTERAAAVAERRLAAATSPLTPASYNRVQSTLASGNAIAAARVDSFALRHVVATRKRVNELKAQLAEAQEQADVEVRNARGALATAAKAVLGLFPDGLGGLSVTELRRMADKRA